MVFPDNLYDDIWFKVKQMNDLVGELKGFELEDYREEDKWEIVDQIHKLSKELSDIIQANKELSSIIKKID